MIRWQSVAVAVVLAALGMALADLPWSRWSWSSSKQPIDYYRRTDQNMPIKAPEFECRCPPQKECTVEFKINEDMPDFLHMRGLLDINNYRRVKEDFDELRNIRNKTNMRRNQAHDNGERDCCCPPRNLLMPAFITDNKFDEINGRFSHQELKWALVTLFQCELLTVTQQSIAGVTYMDKFDFEERYRDVNECNPFHWHPLHMPEHCADMYEKLIRSRIAKNTPVRIYRTQDKQGGNKGKRRQKGSRQGYGGSVYSIDETETDYGYPVDSDSYPIFELTSHEIQERIPLSPYEKMLEMIKQDVMKEPSAPSVQMLPGLGPVAIYRQPISSKTELVIKQIATAYAKAGQESYVDYGPYFSPPIPYKPGCNKTEEIKVDKKTKDKIITKHLQNGGLITVIKKKHPHKKRKPCSTTEVSMSMSKYRR